VTDIYLCYMPVICPQQSQSPPEYQFMIATKHQEPFSKGT